MRRKPNMKDFHRAFLVMELACYSSPQEAADALLEEFGIEITRQSVEHYDVTKKQSRRVAQKWRDLFAVCRQAFIDDTAVRIPETYKAVRIQELAKASRKFKANHNYMAMANMLERIAKEVGGAFTNRTEFTGKDRGPIKFASIDDMTDDQIDAELRQIFKIGDGAKVQPAPETEQ